MKKIFLSLVAVVSAVTLMAQELPTACDAQIEFKYCFTTYGTDAQEIYSFSLPYIWNGVTFPADGEYPMTIQNTIPNQRGCDSIVSLTLSVKFPPVGAAGANKAKLFTVGENKQVFFSQGNLQYRATIDGSGTDLKRTCADKTEQPGIFRFAEHQYDYVGAVGNYAVNYNMGGNVYYDNGGTPKKCDNEEVDDQYKGWIDLFGWGTSGYNNVHPYETNNTYWNGNSARVKENLTNTNYDWGVYNPIENGGNQPGEWRTLSCAEWYYLLTQRPAAASKVAKATIKDDGTTIAIGIILLPDEWDQTKVDVTVTTYTSYSSGTSPHANIGFSNGDYDYKNVFSLSDWNKLEAAGVIFLPVSGWAYQNGSKETYRNPMLRYYTADVHKSGNNMYGGDEIFCESGWLYLREQSDNWGNNRCSVRLVADK